MTTREKSRDATTERHPAARTEVRIAHPVSPEALAMGDIHNGIVRLVERIFDGRETPEEMTAATIRYACQTGDLSPGEEKALLAITRAWDAEAEDLGLKRIRELREGLIEARAGDIAIAAAGVAVGSTELALQSLGGTGATQARRRRRIGVALADLAGAIIGGAIGGVGGAGLGAGIASALVNAALPNND